ncbi:MAG: hypothetical protein ACRDNK_18410 [Solirubrobacteraceae bacterium]
MLASTPTQLMIRPAYGDDYDALARLAALDSADHVPARPLLIAEVDGVLRAALSLADGSSIADPFYRSARLVTLLRTHAAQEPAVVRPAERRLRRHRPIFAQG